MPRSSAFCLDLRAISVRRRFAKAIRSMSVSMRTFTKRWPDDRNGILSHNTEAHPMTTHSSDSNVRPEPDAELVAIAGYVCSPASISDEAYETARYCLMDSLGCAMLALQYPACVRHLGPIVPGTVVPGGVRVPGTNFALDPIKAAFDIGC